jgi:hypothetical protein
MKTITIKKGEKLVNTSLDQFIDDLSERECADHSDTDKVIDLILDLAKAINIDIKRLSELHITIDE